MPRARTDDPIHLTAVFLSPEMSLRVLVANIPLPFNRFLVDLNEAVGQRCALDHSCDRFWEMQGSYDIVQLHFPEYLTFALQDAYRNGLGDELIAATETRLS